MPHCVSHFIGLDAHDVIGKGGGCLVNGNVLTIEPGIYFIDWMIDRALNDEDMLKYINEEVLETYKGFGGVCIEDCVIINDSSVELLQKELPRTTDEIEMFMTNVN